MRIRYLNAVGGISEEEAVAAPVFDGQGYYVLRGNVLLRVAQDLIVSEFHANSTDWPPGILRFIEDHGGELVDGGDAVPRSTEIN